jgi:cold shock CspA family protein
MATGTAENEKVQHEAEQRAKRPQATNVTPA